MQRREKWIAGLLVICGWFALISQLYLILINRTVSAGETIIRYFSFFTILTNLLVTVYFSQLILSRKEKKINPKSLTALTVYILIVGIIYNLILRFLWQPKGLQWITDELLHTVNPLLCLAFWWMAMKGKRLEFKNAYVWLIYPLIYIFYTMIHGHASGFYPYPFVNVSVIGYKQVFINSIMIALCFLVIAWILIAISRKRSQQTNKKD